MRQGCTSTGLDLVFIYNFNNLFIMDFFAFYTFLALALILPVTHYTPVMELTTQYSGWGKTEMVLFGSISHSWGSQTLTHKLSLSSAGEITG